MLRTKQGWALLPTALAVVVLSAPSPVHAQDASETADSTSTSTGSTDGASSPDVLQQDDPAPPAAPVKRRRKTGAESAVENITITGTKKTGGELLQQAPVAASAFDENQLEAFQFRDIESLTFVMPNVSLDAVGTVKGIANFTIRGLGANSSIPSIDPTVGLFINGVYLGTNFGAVLDSFDLEGVEVLRGPQGILFGRNVTGGAVLLRTKRPGDTYSASIKANVETGLEYRLYGAVDAPILEDYVKLRVAGQWRSDAGWFTNLAPGPNFNPALALPEAVTGMPPDLQRDALVEEQFGEEDAWLVRPTVTITPNDWVTLHVMYEHGEHDGQGAPAQNSVRSGTGVLNIFNPETGESTPTPYDDRGFFDDFEFSIDNPGQVRYYTNQVFGELILDLGDGMQLTDIFGYRVVTSRASGDIDSGPLSLFDFIATTDATHWSNELRFTGSFFEQFLDTTIGLYVFGMDLRYREGRILLRDLGMDLNSTYGGDQDQTSVGGFTQLEMNFTDKLKGILGGRVTYEEKEVRIYTFEFRPDGGPCNLPDRDCDSNLQTPFVDQESWFNFSPKIGLQYQITDLTQVYGHWTRGFRSGGYNLRNTDSAVTPGPFNEEQQDVFEIGGKGSFFKRKLRIGLAGFWTLMNDMQREENRPGATGVVQIVRNVADIWLYGVELETVARILPNFVLTGSLGVVDAQYQEVRADLNGDGQPTFEVDEELTVPRLENISANVGAIFDIDLGTDIGFITLRSNYAYRDGSFFTDNNRGILPDGHIVDASIAYTMSDISMGSIAMVPKLTLYGRNLLNEAFFGGQTILPRSFGNNFSPLKEGRVIGAELRIDWL